MKKLTLIALFVLFICTGVNAQYIVTKVNGRVKNGAGEYLRPGSQLKADEHITWSTINDKIWVIIVGKGEKIISPQPGVPHSGPFQELLTSSLHLDSKSGSLSGRGEIIEKIPDALHADVKSTGKIVIEDQNKFLFDPQLYPQTDGSVFFIEIDIPQQAPIIRPLKSVADTLYMTASDLATETTGPDIKYTLGYHSRSAANKSQLVSIFKPYFDITNEVESTIAISIKAYKSGGMPKEAVRDSIYLNVYSTIGKPNGILFMDLFNKYWASNGVDPNRRPVDGAKGELFDPVEFIKVDKLSGSIGLTRDELPDNFSLKQYAPPVGYQGSFGSCTAWSTSYAARTISYAVAHGYSVNNQYSMILSNTFATDFIYNEIKTNPDCNYGTSISKALNFMKTQGDIRRTSDLFQCGKTYNSDDLNTAKNYRIKDYIRINDLNPDNKTLVEKMKSLLVAKHPIPFGMNLPDDFRDVDKTGIWYPTEADRSMAYNVKHNNQSYTGHAMCVIGYNDNINNGSFEVMNSWGSWAANNGFYWINYDDFCDFAMDVFTINDFEPGAAAPEPPAPVTPPVKIIPVTVTVKQQTPVKVIPPVLPKLKGDLEFTLLKDGADPQVIPVNKTTVSTRGQTVDADATNKVASYANFVLSQPFYSGSKYKIRFNLSQSAYVYVIGMDKNSNYNLFPQAKLNESAFVSFNNATLYLPNQTQHYTLDNVTGKEKMCILVSKSPIDVDALNDKLADGDHNFYQDVRDYLKGRLLEITAANFSNTKIDFDTPVKDSDVLAFFVEINHL
jgi:C1A family cysteine protease